MTADAQGFAAGSRRPSPLIDACVPDPIRLIEGIDAKNGPRGGRYDLPTEALATQGHGLRKTDTHDRMPRFFEGNERLCRWDWLAPRQMHRHEHPVVAVHLRRPEWFAVHRH
jgi:hypothetical protein